MLYYSSNKKSEKVTYRDATIKDQAHDNALYFPEVIPKITNNRLNNLKNKSKDEIVFEVIHPYVGGVIPNKELSEICEHTVSFDFPLVRVTDDIYSLELFHGPTLAFKDVGARFMSRCLGYFSKDNNKEV